MDTEKIINDDLKALEQADEVRKKNIVGVMLEHFISRVGDLSEHLNEIREKAKSNNSMIKQFCDIITKELQTACDGRVTVTDYVQKQMSKQTVNVYVGTHWVQAPTQQFYDWVKDGAYKTGLPSIFCEDPKLMNQMFEQMAFRVSRFRLNQVPHGEVWVNMLNGTLELDSRGKVRFREHRAEDFFTYVLPYNYDPMAACPLWHRVLDRVLPDMEQQSILGEYIGYCFTKELRLEKCLILEGPGGNGKSVISELIIRLLGNVNVSKVDWELLTSDENYRSTCVGKLANISQENGQNIKHSILKNMVSGEAVMVKQLYKDPVPTTDYGKLIALFNTLPKTESTNAYVRRLIILPFHQIISEEEKDVQLIDKLEEELSGILNWVLGLLHGLILRKSFTKSVVCDDMVKRYIQDQNSALRFFEERCVLAEDGRMSINELFAAYKTFCQEEGVKNPFGRNTFIKNVETQGVKRGVANGNRYVTVKMKAEY